MGKKKSAHGNFKCVPPEELMLFNYNAPILLVWVKQNKFELDRCIWKLFFVNPQANIHITFDYTYVYRSEEYSSVVSSP